MALDTNSDGRIPVEEFEYFMREHGERLQIHEQAILRELINPLDYSGQVKIDSLLVKLRQYK